MRRPILPLGIGFGIGILAAYYINIKSIYLSIILIAILVFTYIKASNNKSIFTYLIILMALLGALNVNSKYNKDLYDFVDKEAYFTGVVDSVEKSEESSKYEVILKSINGTLIEEKVLLSIYKNLDLEIGQSIELKAEVRIPLENTNPLLFNYRRYLLGKDIEFQLIGNPKTIKILDGQIDLKYSIQRSFYNRVETQFSSLKPQNRDIIKSLLLGASVNQDQGEYEKYKELGLAHILAISGLHIGIIASFFIYIFSIIGIKRKHNYFITLAILWTYGFLIGLPPSTLRALIMFSTIIVSKLWHKPYDFLNILALSFIVSLSINPFSLFNIGFQLSYIATISLALILPKLKQYIYPHKSNVVDSLMSVLAVNIGIFPIQSLYFNEFPVYTFIANILVLPIATINLILGFLNLGSDIFVPLLDILLTIQSLIVDYIYKLPMRTFYLSSFKIGEILIYYSILIVFLNLRKLESIKINIKKVIFISFVYSLVILSFNTLKANDLEIDFIDVGQGDSIFIKKGTSEYLIDTGGSVFGSFDVGERILLPYLIKTGNRNIDGVIISHFDKDHYGALPSLINNINIASVLVGSKIPDLELDQSLKDLKIPVINIYKGSKITIDKDTKLEIIYPDKDLRRNRNENDNSLVIILEAYNKRVLFTGDIESRTEEKFVKDGIKPVDILKIPHHGSKTSSTKEFVSMLAPKMSVISVGRNNTFNHPSSDVIQRLESFNTEIYRTDTMGLIKIIINKKGIEVRPYYGPSYRENIKDLLDLYIEMIIGSILYILAAYLSIKEYKRLEDSRIELQ